MYTLVAPLPVSLVKLTHIENCLADNQRSADRPRLV